MASLGRFELPTYRLGGGCSVHLSYRDAASNLAQLMPAVAAGTRFNLETLRTISRIPCY